MDKIWPKFQKKLGYTDEELDILRSVPQYEDMVRNSLNFMESRIIAEVIDARGCMAGHEVGQKIVMDGNGHLLRDECPSRMCIFLLGPLMSAVPTIMQTLKDNTDPNKSIFHRVRCADVAVENGGWGTVLLNLYAEGHLADQFKAKNR
ncbi:MAG: hypothetical protein SV775_02110 [Thermodesulfobacteriota bacterium]|nr:hypothetical protein [Thermodesulfobacteriota bacterium]